MSFGLQILTEAVARHGRVARVVVTSVEGSAPREVGAAMLVWDGGQSGTIGGGALEWEAAARALTLLGEAHPFPNWRGALPENLSPIPSPKAERGGAPGDVPPPPPRGRGAGREVAPPGRVERVPLGPGLGQCCGGAVTLLTEVWDAGRLAGISDIVARPLPGGPPEMPLAVGRLLAAARNGSGAVRPGLVQGWMVEPVATPARPLWIWGAGHVGRALVAVMAPLPGFALTWVDTSAHRFPQVVPDGVSPLVAADPGAVVGYAPPDAKHLILTYSHALDLDLCHRLLGHGFGWCGLIGSATKWARFRSRLRQLGHGDDAISRISCPIGQKAFGKHPQAIAVGVAATLLSAEGQARRAWGTG